MTLVLLVRHALTDVTGKRLYGRSRGISLSEAGREQAERLGARFEGLRLDGLYSSPLERCMETATAIAARTGTVPEPLEDVVEIDYGEWTGRPFTTLRRTKLWRELHGGNPSAVRFPGGETLAEAQRRTVTAIADLAERHPRKRIAVVTHGDVVSLVLAHFAGVHVDLFQRIEVAPASVSAISVGGPSPRLHRVNDVGDLSDLLAASRRR